MPYTSSKAQSGRGAQVQIGGVTGAAGTETWTIIGEVTESSRSGSQWGTADVTNFQSGGDEEFITTTRNNGEITLVMNRVSGEAGQVALKAAYDSGLKYDFKITYPLATGQTTTGDTDTFSALVLSFDNKLDVKNAITRTVKLKVSGGIATATGS